MKNSIFILSLRHNLKNFKIKVIQILSFWVVILHRLAPVNEGIPINFQSFSFSLPAVADGVNHVVFCIFEGQVASAADMGSSFNCCDLFVDRKVKSVMKGRIIKLHAKDRRLGAVSEMQSQSFHRSRALIIFVLNGHQLPLAFIWLIFF